MSTETAIKLLTALIAAIGVAISVLQFLRVQSIEAAKPYLERKLAWCEEAVETAATLATRDDAPADKKARFWELYWGVMGLVEQNDITSAMIAFGGQLDAGTAAQPGRAPTPMKTSALDLAHACRAELASEWSLKWAR